MRKRLSEEQIRGFLRESDNGKTVKDLCCRHGFSEAKLFLVTQQVKGHGRFGRESSQRA